MRLALRIGRRLDRHLRHCAAEMPDEDLALRAWQFANTGQQSSDHGLGQIHEIMALPVIARPRREQRIERGLPLSERLWADRSGDWLAQTTELGKGRFSVPHVAAIAGGER